MVIEWTLEVGYSPLRHTVQEFAMRPIDQNGLPDRYPESSNALGKRCWFFELYHCQHTLYCCPTLALRHSYRLVLSNLPPNWR
ncbi:Uncharacterised protein [Vibrio cholerae]|nr:Uncharacterised protein [Vibrio cholerae]CSC30750.1 Uncharacterised protein [Vibrio cholerae]CSC81427.1 Uncharacterised protein [Vibrio cholerae]CSI53120.1 Uncharacterised protein [Vibrio cholerae]